MAKPKIFVSHSTKDTAFASTLVNDLNTAGAQAWMDVNDLGAGNFQANISKALADCEWFLLVLTPNALSSDWVRMEVDAAIRLKHQKRIKELIFIKAADVDHTDFPALWGVFNVFDATADYATALAKTVKEVGLSPITKDSAPTSTTSVDPANAFEKSAPVGMLVSSGNADLTRHNYSKALSAPNKTTI
jgi:TIR domain